MLVIIEGPNGAGKSTFAEKLRLQVLAQFEDAEPANTFLLHKGPPQTHPLEEYEAPLLEYTPGVDHIICDRWHIGESVYPKVYGRPTQLDTAVARHLELFMRSRGAVYVVMIPSLGQLIASHGLRNEAVDSAQLSREIGGFVNIVTHRPQHYTVWRDWVMDRERLYGVINEATQRELMIRRLNGFRTYVGSHHPRFLLLGDMRGVQGPGPDDKRPAFMPYLGTSGHFLLSHFDVPGHNGGLANACDVDDVSRLWRVLGYPPVVALGNEAAKTCDELNVPHGTVPHPQYVRRFHHGSGELYGKMIWEATATGEDYRKCSL